MSLAREVALVLRALIGLLVALPFATPVALGSSPAHRWRAAVQSAPGREVLPMLAQQDVPDMLALANGKAVVAGTINAGAIAIAELLPTGRLDPSFGAGGVELSRIKLLPWQIRALPGGKILILGPNRLPGAQSPVVRRFPDWELLRLRPNGAPDPSFGHGGLLDVSGVPVAGEGANHEVAPELAPDGDILLPTIIGPVLSPDSVSGLVALKADGSRDTSFGNAGAVRLPALLDTFSVGPDGSIVVTMSQRAGALLMRLSTGGSPDPSFNGGSPLQLSFHGVDSTLVAPDGGIELHGYQTSNQLIDSGVWRFTAGGAADANWGSAGASDLGPSSGYINELLPAGNGATLLVTLGVPPASGLGSGLSGATRVRIRRLTATGQIDSTLGGPGGLAVALPFGGGSYAPGAIANLREDSFAPSGVIQRTDGTLLFNGFVEASEAIRTEGGPEALASSSGSAIAALNGSFALDRRFGGRGSLRLGAHLAGTHLTRRGIAVRLRASSAGLCVVSARAGGQTIARGSVALLAKSPSSSMDRATTTLIARIPLTSAGRRLLRHHRHLRITVLAAASDLAANHVTARTSAVVVS